MMAFVLFYYNPKRPGCIGVQSGNELQKALATVNAKGCRVLALTQGDASSFHAFLGIVEQYQFVFQGRRRNIMRDYSNFVRDYCPDIRGLLLEASLIQVEDLLVKRLEEICQISYRCLFSLSYWLTWKYRKVKTFDDGMIELYGPKVARTSDKKKARMPGLWPKLKT